jgi:hypothetical protein
MLLVIVVGLTGYAGLSRDAAPSRDFTDLELSLPGQAGSCYALGTLLVANGIDRNGARTWKKAGDDAWRLTVERVVQGYAGPEREFSTWTFEKRGKAIELTAVEASQGQPQDPATSIEQLLSAPNSLHSTPVERCREPGAAGYLYTRK